ncbi:MAG TPA: cytochrome c3 family protein [Anaerolineaceae bacterium]
MPPIFPPRSNTIARASILAVLVLLVVVTGGLVWYVHSSTFTQVGVTIPQPVPFPHSFHVGVVGLNCRYCHESVDKSSFAGMPPTETCMSCHSIIKTSSPLLAPVRDSYKTGQPVQWNRVYKVPDYVYFNHEIHVNKGVACETCHGRVDQQATAVRVKYFYMSWCLDCHRDPTQYLRPKDKVYEMGYTPSGDQKTVGAQLVKDYNVMPPSQLTNCSICHR